VQRSFQAEILDGDGVPPEMAATAHRALSRSHTLLGNHAAILRALRRDGRPVRRVLDLGCGHGDLMRRIHERIGADVVGIDLRPPVDARPGFPIHRLDAVRDALPQADVAVSVCMAHHLADEELLGMIRNVGLSCPRLVILDVVRHRVPMFLFSALAPLLLPRVNVLDGRQSIRRACTTTEFRALVDRALSGTGATVRHTTAPLWIRQIADIRYGPRPGRTVVAAPPESSNALPRRPAGDR